MNTADIDFETYSEAGFVWNASANKWDALPNAPQGKKGLPVVGMAKYAMHPSTEILVMAYNLHDGSGPKLWVPGNIPPLDLFLHIGRGGLVEAWNSGFEHWIWNEVAVPRHAWPPLPQRQLRCAAAKSRASGYPSSLANAAKVLQLATQKDTDGDRLIRKFCMPRNPTVADPRTRIRPLDDPEDAARLYAYCATDIAAEKEASSRLPDLVGDELEYWLADQAINKRGVALDVASVDAARDIVAQALERYTAELYALTGIDSPSKVAALAKWCGLESLDAAHTDEALAGDDISPQVRRALEIRQTVGSAAVKKLYSMHNRATDKGRLHDLFIYHGAATGRCTGDAVQPTNMPNSGPEVRTCDQGHWFGRHHNVCPQCGAAAGPPTEWGPDAVDAAISVISKRSLDYVEYVFGPEPFTVVSGCLRGMLVAATGHDLICSDYSAIEAVVLAMMAGEQWRADVFNTHGKIYEQSASKISGVPFHEFMFSAGYTADELLHPDWYTRKPSHPTDKHHPLRKTIGKVAELASGYGGWIGAWKNFGADKFLTEKEIKDSILAWRKASPMIVEFWGGQFRGNWEYKRPERYGLEGMAINAIEHPGIEFGYRDVTYYRDGDALYCRLPSGRLLTYNSPRLRPSERGGLAISYSRWNTNKSNGAVNQWITVDTYGGRLCENVVQAVARDIQRHSILGLEAAGYPVVLHVYDEDISEVPEGYGSIDEFESIMSTMPDWAAGWPIRANGGFRAKRYRK